MSGRKFDPMHHILKRPQYELRVYGHEDKPYVCCWLYPKKVNGRFAGQETRHMLATEEQALEFAVKHKCYYNRVPPALRKKLCQLARTAGAINSTS